MSKHHLEMLDLQSGCAMIEATHPELAEIFRAVKLPKEDMAAAFGYANYSYGASIVHEGKFVLPCDCVDCTSKRSLFPHDIPLGLVLKNNLEITRMNGIKQHRPVRLLRQGEVFGIFEALDRHNGDANQINFEIFSGARIFIANVVDQNKPIIKHAESVYPRCVKRGEHGKDVEVDWWEAVRSWMAKTNFPWTSKVVYVTDALMQASEDRLTPYLYRVAWQQMQDKRQEADESLFSNVTILEWKASLKYLMGVATEKFVGYTPVTGNDASGPLLEFLRDLNTRDLKKNRSVLPLMLEPAYFTPGADALPIFHSLSAGPRKVIDRFSEAMANMVTEVNFLPQEYWVAYAHNDSHYQGPKIADYSADLFGTDFEDQLAINEHTKLYAAGFFTAFFRIKPE